MHVHIFCIEMPLILLVMYRTEIRFEGLMSRSRSYMKCKNSTYKHNGKTRPNSFLHNDANDTVRKAYVCIKESQFQG